MFTNFKELEAYVLSHKNKKRIVLANAHDEPALSAVVNAHRRGVVDGTLLGKKDEILALLREMNEDPAEYEIVDFDGPELDAAKAAVQLVREGKADIPMKGILQTSSFAKAILNRETGLIPASGRRLVSQCGIFEYEGRFMMITDAAINIAPDVDTQIGIVENALPVANALGVELPKVAVLSAVENVTEKMPSTVSAAEIAKRGIPGCVVSGPWRWTVPSPWSPSSTRAFTTPWRARRTFCWCPLSRSATCCTSPSPISPERPWPAPSAAPPAR